VRAQLLHIVAAQTVALAGALALSAGWVAVLIACLAAAALLFILFCGQGPVQLIKPTAHPPHLPPAHLHVRPPLLRVSSSSRRDASGRLDVGRSGRLLSGSTPTASASAAALVDAAVAESSRALRVASGRSALSMSASMSPRTGALASQVRAWV
jgi:hypothetical protein